MSMRDNPLRLALMDVLSFAATPEDVLSSASLARWSKLDSGILRAAWSLARAEQWVTLKGYRWHRITPKGLAVLHRMTRDAGPYDPPGA